MRIEVQGREIDEYRNRKGSSKTDYWRRNKQAIVAQGQEEERRAKQKRRK